MNITTATLRGDGHINQDTVISTDRAVAVLDGASAWLPQQPGRDGGWYSRNLGSALLPLLDQDRPLVEILADAIEQVRDRHKLEPGSTPDSTVTIARWDAKNLNILVLSDSPAIIFGPEDKPIQIRDDRLQAAGAQARKIYQDHLRAGRGYGPDLHELLSELQRQEFTVQNREGGYWVAEAMPEAATHAYTAEYSLQKITAVILLTDGAAAGVNDYGIPKTWTEALSLIRDNPARFLADLHAAEDDDASGRRWPRAKCHDDKTLALIMPL